MSVEEACIYTGAVFFSCALKFKKDMPTVSFMTTPLGGCMYNI